MKRSYLTLHFTKAFPDMNYSLLICLWSIVIIIVNPLGEFPLNDDWAYNKDVLLFLETGRFKFVDWSAMTLVSQLILGAAVCKIFTFSFSLLRILTAIVGLIGILTTYKLLKELNINKRVSFFIVLLIAGNPLYISLSNTFMTDVYYFTFTVLALLFYNKSFRTPNFFHVFIATIFALIAIFTRQIGIVIPISVALAYLYKAKLYKRSYILFVYFLSALTVVLLIIYNYWFSSSVKEQSCYYSMSTVISNLGLKIFEQGFYRIGTTGMTLGLFLFPILILLLPN